MTAACCAKERRSFSNMSFFDLGPKQIEQNKNSVCCDLMMSSDSSKTLQRCCMVHLQEFTSCWVPFAVAPKSVGVKCCHHGRVTFRSLLACEPSGKYLIRLDFCWNNILNANNGVSIPLPRHNRPWTGACKKLTHALKHQDTV